MTTGIICKDCRKDTELSVIEGFFKCVNPVCKNYQQHVAKDVQWYKKCQGSLDMEFLKP
ncbi:MAG: hypothetical protein ACREBJ_04245 [Nitrosotalea sp.]